jgi:hypothetical protein
LPSKDQNQAMAVPIGFGCRKMALFMGAQVQDGRGGEGAQIFLSHGNLFRGVADDQQRALNGLIEGSGPPQ